MLLGERGRIPAQRSSLTMGTTTDKAQYRAKGHGPRIGDTMSNQNKHNGAQAAATQPAAAAQPVEQKIMIDGVEYTPATLAARMAELMGQAATAKQTAAEALAAKEAAELAAKGQAVVKFSIKAAHYSETHKLTPLWARGMPKGMASITLPSRPFGKLELTAAEWNDLRSNQIEITAFFTENAAQLATEQAEIARLKILHPKAKA